MQLATKMTLLAAAALAPASMLIETASAVETSEVAESVLPAPASAVAGPSQAAAAAPPSRDSFILGARSFTIPFTVDAAGATPVEVCLLVSHGASEGWHLLAKKRPDVAVKVFEFSAPKDGEYWFATRAIDGNGQAHPGTKIEPQLKVFVDTVKPVVTFRADADADGRVDAHLVIDDATPVRDMLLRYVTDSDTQSQQVDVGQLLPDGKLSFTPNDQWQRLSLQLIATDSAGNQTVVNQVLQRPRLAEMQHNRYASASTDTIETRTSPYRVAAAGGTAARAVSNPFVESNLSQRVRAQVTTGRYAADSARGSRSALRGFRGGSLAPAHQSSTPPGFSINRPLGPSAHSPAPHMPAPTAITRPAASDQSGAEFALNGPEQSTIPPRALGRSTQEQAKAAKAPESVPAPQSEQAAAEPTRPRTAQEAMRPLSEKSAVPTREGLRTPKTESESSADRYKSRRANLPALSRAPVRHSDSERFSLEYELEAVGNLGVEAIELYGSADGGNSWDLWGRDPDRSSPFDIETKEEGVFAFRIVVVGGNGLASPRPLAGETPDIVVVVDKTTPQVRITGAQYGEGNRIGSLVIQYECEDTNLSKRPIALSFSDAVDGPWTTIAAGLRNDGDYVWPADPQVPRQLYLRIDAKDEAGNVGTHVLNNPIDARGLAPRARIRGFQSLSGMEPPPIDEQTAGRPRARIK